MEIGDLTILWRSFYPDSFFIGLSRFWYPPFPSCILSLCYLLATLQVSGADPSGSTQWSLSSQESLIAPNNNRGEVLQASRMMRAIIDDASNVLARNSTGSQRFPSTWRLSRISVLRETRISCQRSRIRCLRFRPWAPIFLSSEDSASSVGSLADTWVEWPSPIAVLAAPPSCACNTWR